MGFSLYLDGVIHRGRRRFAKNRVRRWLRVTDNWGLLLEVWPFYPPPPMKMGVPRRSPRKVVRKQKVPAPRW